MDADIVTPRKKSPRKPTEETAEDLMTFENENTPSTSDNEMDTESDVSGVSTPRKSNDKIDAHIVTSNTPPPSPSNPITGVQHTMQEDFEDLEDLEDLDDETDANIVTSDTPSQMSTDIMDADIVTYAHNLKSIIDNNSELELEINTNASQLITMITKANPIPSPSITSSLTKEDMEIELTRLENLIFNRITESAPPSDGGASRTVKLQPLLPDPAVFDGNVGEFEDWYFSMRDKLRGDNYFFVSEVQKIAYISRHVGGLPKDYINSKNSPRGVTGPRWVTAVQLMDELWRIYGDKDIKKRIRAFYKQLEQNDRPFGVFKVEFLTLARMLERDDDAMVAACKLKLTSELREHIEEISEEQELSFEDLVRACEHFEETKLQRKPEKKVRFKKGEEPIAPRATPDSEPSNDELNEQPEDDPFEESAKPKGGKQKTKRANVTKRVTRSTKERLKPEASDAEEPAEPRKASPDPESSAEKHDEDKKKNSAKNNKPVTRGPKASPKAPIAEQQAESKTGDKKTRGPKEKENKPNKSAK